MLDPGGDIDCLTGLVQRRSLFPRLVDQFYGERGGRVRDPFGQQWMMSQHIEDVPADEMARRAAAFFSQ